MSQDRNNEALQVPPVSVEDLASRYVAESGWTPLLGVVADRAGKLWTQFELSYNVQELRTALSNLKRATASPTTQKDKWHTDYREKLASTFAEVRGMLREAFVVRKANEALRLEAEERHEEIKAQARIDLEALKGRKQEAQRKLDLELIGLGGVKENQIHPPKKESAKVKLLWWAAEAFLILVTLGVELVIGQEAIASRTNPGVARVLVGALAVFTFIVIHVGMKALRGYIASWSAERRYKNAKKAGEQIEDARLFPYPATKKATAFAGVAILSTIVIGLLQQRLSIAEQAAGSIASGSSGDATTALGLVAIIAISAAFVFSREHDYTPEQYAEVERLRAELSAATLAVEAKRKKLTELEQPHDFDPVDTFVADIAAAKKYYNDTMKEEEDAIKKEAAQLEAQRSAIFSQWAMYLGAYPLYEAAALEAMIRLVNLVQDHEHKEENDPPVPPSDEESRKARTMLAEKTERTLGKKGEENDAFVKTVVNVSFPVSFPYKEKHTDFEGTVEEVRAELEAPEEFVAAPAPEPPKRKRTNAGVV